MLSFDVYQAGKDALGYIKGKMKEDPVLLEKFNVLWKGLLDLQEENIELRSELEKLKKEYDLKKQLVWDSVAGVYWKDENGGKVACCPACFNNDGQAVFMKQSNGGWICPGCNYSEVPARKIVKKSRKGWL